MRYRGWGIGVWLAGLFAFGCGEPTEPEAAAVFEVQVVDEKFRVGVNDPIQIDSFAARLAAGMEGNINGALVRGAGGVNAPWSWHLDPETVQVADVTIEVCDGRPSDIEKDLDYWFGTVKRYCPWGVKVVGRVR